MENNYTPEPSPEKKKDEKKKKEKLAVYQKVTLIDHVRFPRQRLYASMKRKIPIVEFLCDSFLFHFLLSDLTLESGKALSRVDKYLLRIECVQELSDCLFCRNPSGKNAAVLAGNAYKLLSLKSALRDFILSPKITPLPLNFFLDQDINPNPICKDGSKLEFEELPNTEIYYSNYLTSLVCGNSFNSKAFLNSFVQSRTLEQLITKSHTNVYNLFAEIISHGSASDTTSVVNYLKKTMIPLILKSYPNLYCLSTLTYKLTEMNHEPHLFTPAVSYFFELLVKEKVKELVLAFHDTQLVSTAFEVMQQISLFVSPNPLLKEIFASELKTNLDILISAIKEGKRLPHLYSISIVNYVVTIGGNIDPENSLWDVIITNFFEKPLSSVLLTKYQQMIVKLQTLVSSETFDTFFDRIESNFVALNCKISSNFDWWCSVNIVLNNLPNEIVSVRPRLLEIKKHYQETPKDTLFGVPKELKAKQQEKSIFDSDKFKVFKKKDKEGKIKESKSSSEGSLSQGK